MRLPSKYWMDVRGYCTVVITNHRIIVDDESLMMIINVRAGDFGMHVFLSLLPTYSLSILVILVSLPFPRLVLVTETSPFSRC